MKHENSSKENPCKELAMYALSCLSTPVSNATMKGVYSHVAILKTKTRNKMSLKLLDPLTSIKTSLKMQGKCHVDFEVPDQILSGFNNLIYEDVGTAI